jgi:mono/diheme cytochrome c family protein
MRRNATVLGGLALVAGCLVAANVWQAPAQEQPKQEQPKADAQIERGAYLVNEVARCGDCHTPRNDKGQLDSAKHLQGAPIWFTSKIAFKKWHNTAPDLTASGIATKWSEEKLVKFLSTGVQADMPMPAYRLTVDDAKAVTAYLRSLPGKVKQ